AELVRQAALVEPDLGAAPINVHRGDGVLERGIGLPLEARWAGTRVDSKGGRRQLRRTRGYVRTPQYWETWTHRWHTIFQDAARSQRGPAQRCPALTTFLLIAALLMSADQRPARSGRAL